MPLRHVERGLRRCVPHASQGVPGIRNAEHTACMSRDREGLVEATFPQPRGMQRYWNQQTRQLAAGFLRALLLNAGVSRVDMWAVAQAT